MSSPSGQDCARSLLSAIADFQKAYGNDTRFREAISQLKQAEGSIENLVPGLEQSEPGYESPGRRSAREAAEEAQEKPPPRPPPPGPEPKAA